MNLNFILIFLLNYFLIFESRELLKKCNLSDGSPGLFRLKANCKNYNSTNENSGICNGYTLCSDLICCPLENLGTEDYESCSYLNDPEEIMFERLRGYDKCQTKENKLNGVFYYLDDCEYYKNISNDKIERACEFEFCDIWVCCPQKNWTSRPKRIYADQIYRHTEILGGACTIESTGKQGECRLDLQCPTYHWNDENTTVCGFDKCSRIICCDKVDIPSLPTSEQYCQKYSKYAYDKTRIISQLSPTNDEGFCLGTSSITDHTVVPKEYAHSAALGYKNENNSILWKCTGAILNENFILTSKLCFNNLTIVRIGTLGTNHDAYIIKANCIKNFEIDKMISHNESDIGLIKLKKKIYFNTLMRPACLLHNDDVKNYSKILSYLYNDNSNGIEQLLKIHTTLVSYNETVINVTVHYSHESRNLSKIIIPGDPVHDDRQTNYLMSNIIGLVSYVGDDSYISITRISPYIKWIEENIWNDDVNS